MTARSDRPSDTLRRLIPAGEGLGYRVGTVKTWNPVTAEHAIELDGALYTDLPIIASEALTLRPDDRVAVLSTGKSMAIFGQWVEPGTDRAAEFMAGRVYSAQVDTQEGRTNTAYGDLTTTGPTLTDVPVPATGRVLVFFGTKIGWDITAASPSVGGAAALQMSGANTLTAADTFRAASFGNDASLSSARFHGSFAAFKVMDGLTPGLTTFTLKYRAFFSGVLVDFQQRNLSVILL